jgi:hypothetical protein
VPPPIVYDDEEMMLEAMAIQGHRVHISSGMCHRLDTRFKLELGDQVSTLLNEVGVHPDARHQGISYALGYLEGYVA